MAQQHSIPGGTVVLRDAEEVLEKHVRRINSLRFAMAQNSDVLSGAQEVQAKQAAGEELTDEDELRLAAQMAEAMPLIQQLEDASIAAKLKSWSFEDEDGNPLPPKAESLPEIPSAAYERLKELCASVVNDVQLDTEVSPDPKASTSSSTG